ncbi:MAG: peptidylprolyl isomerase [Prevotella sp.]|nr:peptidylprolyl isomerase [Prevotella sp.]MEE3444797.1 peptidylprolyl isomerase [Prevotella sp.]
MKKHLMFLTLLFSSVAAVAQKNDPVIMTVNGVDVPRSEFEYSYNKNNADGVIDKKTVEEYVDLFINYKLKVAAALDARLDTLTSFKQEFAMYRDQQVRPAMVTDADVLNEAREIYDRTKEAIGTKGLILPAHILIRVSSNASQQEEDKARIRIDSVYQALLGGADFAELAKKVSDDRGSASNGGELSWIGPNQTLKEFEDAAYALQKGEMSKPVLSPVGFHIIQMKDRKQLEPFDSLRNTIIRGIEQRGIRNQIAEQKVKQIVEQSGGAMTPEMVMNTAADSLSEVDPEMKYLIQEYHDGLLLYEVSNREVWEKAAKDEAGLAAYFKDHKKDYAWSEPRYKGMAYHVKTKADVKAVKNCVKKLPFDQWAEALRQTFNPDSVIRIRVEKGLFKAGDNRVVDSLVFKVTPGPKAKPAKLADYPIDAVYGKKLKKGPEDYTDVRGQVTEDYQNMLEKAWVYDLRRRYKYSVNQEILKTVNKHQ